MMKQYLEAGEFVTTHGIAGELRIYPWSDDTAFLTRFTTFYLSEDGGKPVQVLQVRPHKNICIVKLDGVNTVAEARPYIGKTVYIYRDDAQLPPGRHFVQDLLGLNVLDADTGKVYGTIAAITHPGRHDVYEVQQAGESTALFPATEPFLCSIDLEKQQVLVRPIPGMFDELAEAPEQEAKPGGGSKKNGQKAPPKGEEDA